MPYAPSSLGVGDSRRDQLVTPASEKPAEPPTTDFTHAKQLMQKAQLHTESPMFTFAPPQTAPATSPSGAHAALPWYKRRRHDIKTGIDAEGSRLAAALAGSAEVEGGVATGDFHPLVE
jgi:hypothetical protein